MLDDEVVIRLLDRGTVVSADGHRLGRVGQLFRSDSDGESTWVSVDSGGPGDDQQTLVPMAGSRIDGDDLHVDYPAAAVSGAPQVAVGAPVSGDDEERVRAFYSLDQAADASNTATDVLTMVRSEEHLKVATRWVPVRRARLEKFQVTETRTIEVPWTREDVRVVYDGLDGTADAAQGTAGTADPAGTGESTGAVAPLAAAFPRPWVLMEERIVVTKQWVPTQTVRLVVDRVSGQQEITEPVRKEQIGLDHVDAAAPSAAGDPTVTD